MFDRNERDYLIQKLVTNQVVLFLGAGFSSGANNVLGLPFPTGKSLSKILWYQLGMSGEYDGTNLKKIFEVYLNSNIPKTDKETLLTESTYGTFRRSTRELRHHCECILA